MLGDLHDDTIMLWGRYKGERLGDIPDDYWLWFLKQDWCGKYPQHVKYANYVLPDYLDADEEDDWDDE